MLTDIKGEIDSNTIIVGDFNTPLTSMDRSSRDDVNKGTVALSETLHQMDLIDKEHSIQMQQDTHSSQEHVEHSQA